MSIVVHVHIQDMDLKDRVQLSLGYYTQVVALAQNIPHTTITLLPDESNLHQIREVFESCKEKQQMNS